ncbi:MAG: HAD family hydrolase [Nitrospirota bacterium]|nr:HAD family hydrolase [Nitrospirota bacterium]
MALVPPPLEDEAIVTEKKKALFLDRDGTLIVDRDYLGDPDGVELLPGVGAALYRAMETGFLLVVVSNQSGVGRGYFPESAIAGVNGRMAEYLAKDGVRIDGYYHCPHRPDEGCRCRKPEPGMVEDAVRDMGIDASVSFVIGDKSSDVVLARRTGAKGILVTGTGKQDQDITEADHVAETLAEAVEWAINETVRIRS